MPKPAIEIKDIHKEFVLPQTKNSSVKSAFVNIVKKNKKTIQKVLDGVSFTINEGDFFGIVGRNGSGKSTLLKIIAGVYSPTSGSIKLHGGLTPFIELGVGFNPELSGRDNVFLNGALLGFTRKQMEEMYDEIVEFAELEPFMDQKLKNYSSGMQVRLAFSVAIKASNDIMIFDEVLAVGDEAFQEKCLRQFSEFKKQGRTVVLVTHSMAQVEKFCNRAVVLEGGLVEYEGGPSSAASLYSAINLADPNEGREQAIKEEARPSVVISSVNLLDNNGGVSNVFLPKEDLLFEVIINSKKEIKDAFLAVRACESQTQTIIAGFDNNQAGKKIDIKKGRNILRISSKSNPLIKGKFYMIAGLYESSKRKTKYAFFSGLEKNQLFMIDGDKQEFGLVEIEVDWT